MHGGRTISGPASYAEGVSTTAASTESASPPSYDERLAAPFMFWVALIVIVILGVLEVGSGFNYVVLVPVAIFMVGFFLVPFAITSLTRVRIRDGVLTANGKDLPVMSIAGVSALDPDQTRLRIGPQADPAAVLVHKGWIRTSIMLRLSNPHPVPYWVISTRRPDELAATIKAARNYIRATR
jgi:hypothetical protein